MVVNHGLSSSCCVVIYVVGVQQVSYEILFPFSLSMDDDAMRNGTRG